jgi:hypothetical protein
LVFIDETGVNLAMTRHYARAEKGKRASKIKEYLRSQESRTNQEINQAINLVTEPDICYKY